MISHVFAAAVIGGLNLDGSEGSLFGAPTGVILLGVLQDMLTLPRIPAFWIDAAYGAIILAGDRAPRRAGCARLTDRDPERSHEMSEIILHHYPLSTFSEKARLALGLKGLAWRSVITPVMMPKPDLVALTGGYRRAPVMQIGADIYCDTQLILRTLERLHPDARSFYPGGLQGQAEALAWWAERYVFMPALGFVANVNPELYPPAFSAERKPFGYLLAKEDVAPLFDRYVQQLTGHLAWLAAMLADGRPFLLGAEPSAADLGAFPAIWFLRLHGKGEAEARLAIERFVPWVERVAALGHGRPTELSGAQAIEIARGAAPAGIEAIDADPTGIAVGTRVTVTPDDVGRDPVAGTLVAADSEVAVIRRDDPQLGAVHMHVPRAGYDLRRAA